MRVSLVGTSHGEQGLVTVEALQAILERIQPEVIFAEIPADYIVRYKDGSHSTLESIAVARYLTTRHVDVEPVDLACPEQKFFDDMRDLFRAVDRTSHDYRRLMDLNSHEARAGGFPYLNSDRCAQAWTNIYREVLATVEWIGDRRLREIYDRVTDTNERRDREMLRNIMLYSASQTGMRGVFLVGAAHRKSIIDKAFAESGPSVSQVEWDLAT